MPPTDQPTLAAHCRVADDGAWVVPARQIFQWIDYDEWPRDLLINVRRADRCPYEVEPGSFVDISAVLQVDLGVFVYED